jgi:hypothetical protein
MIEEGKVFLLNFAMYFISSLSQLNCLVIMRKDGDSGAAITENVTANSKIRMK